MRGVLILGVPGLLGSNYWRKAVSITGTSAGELTDYPIKLSVSYEPEMLADFGDLRFVDANGNQLDYWRESYVESDTATVWVKVPVIPAEPDTVTVYMYYGNQSLSDDSDGSSVFALFDDFSGESGITVPDAIADNAAAPLVPNGLLGENIVYDTVTEKYWWIFEDRRVTPWVITLASADAIDGAWTVEASPVLAEAGHRLVSPHLCNLSGTWYIYYGRCDDTSSSPSDVWVQSSSTVNSGYAATGITNPVLARGAASTWEERRVLEPYVWQIGATYYMLYMGEDTAELEKVGLATSSDPVSGWTKEVTNPVLSGATGSWDGGKDRAADPHVVYANGTYYVGVAASYRLKSNWQTGFFTTSDFLTYTPCNNPVLPRGSSGAWDENGAWRGAVVEVDGIYYLSYSGVSGNTYRAGITTIEFMDRPFTGQLDNAIWNKALAPSPFNGQVLCTDDTYIYSKAVFGQNTALRVRATFGTVAASVLAYRVPKNNNYLEILANYPATNDIRGYQYVSAAASTDDLADAGVTAIYEIKRNSGVSGLYTVDDGVEAEVTAQVTSTSLPVTAFGGTVWVDWMLVRPYNSPEPVAEFGSAERGDYA